jgi:hypothetical protein
MTRAARAESGQAALLFLGVLAALLAGARPQRGARRNGAGQRRRQASLKRLEACRTRRDQSPVPGRRFV